jgi:hypothetical protein
VRRETGKEFVVQVHFDEGVAIHIGPMVPASPEIEKQLDNILAEIGLI